MTTIYYTVPADGDDQAHPNMYKIPNTSAKELTLAKIAQVRYIFVHIIFSNVYDDDNKNKIDISSTRKLSFSIQV